MMKNEDFTVTVVSTEIILYFWELWVVVWVNTVEYDLVTGVSLDLNKHRGDVSDSFETFHVVDIFETTSIQMRNPLLFG